MSEPSGYARALVKTATVEFDAFHEVVETDEPLRSRINVYCTAIGVDPPDDISAFPWSAVFVSWCIKSAGATDDEFKFSDAHAVFIKSCIASADAQTGVFRARPVDAYKPKIGDLIHRNRSRGTITYKQARMRSNYPSHSAIVVEIGQDDGGQYAITVGGNESDSIRRTRVGLTTDGFVRQLDSNPFICVVEDLKDGVPVQARVAAVGHRPMAAGEQPRFARMLAPLAATDAQRTEMAQEIVNFEARRDAAGHLTVYNLPAGDGGGRYEVCGINERYDKQECDRLVALINDGRADEAETEAVAYIAGQTDKAAAWTSVAAVDFYLRDCIFNRGQGGAAWILQKSVGVSTDMRVGPVTIQAVTRAEGNPQQLLQDLRASREQYEREVVGRDESSKFWKGLVNRWNNALTFALHYLQASSAGAAGIVARPKVARANYAFGWRPELPDHRDLPYGPMRMRLEQPVQLPLLVDLRPQCSPVYDQGQLGSCTANAIAALFSFDRRKQGLPDDMLSRLFIYYNERSMEGTTDQDSGAFIRDGIKSIATLGVCKEAEWPYDISAFAKRPVDSCYQSALRYIAVNYYRLNNETINELKTCLAAGFPFVFGFTVFQSFLKANTNGGIVPMPANEPTIGGHAVVAVGYDDARERFIIRNSWGTSVGDQGYYYMPYQYMTTNNLSDDFWTVRLVTMAALRPQG